MEDQIEKIYWRISEVAEMFSVEPSCIRFWLQTFRVTVKKNRNGIRYFTKEDIEKVAQINRLLKEELYTIPGARRKLQNG